MLVFISGGVRSGKSSWAERLAVSKVLQLGNGRLNYIATAVRTDKEMAERITHHQKKRSADGFQWRTWEQPERIEKIANNFTEQDVVLLDCLTTLVNNEFFSFYKNQSVLKTRIEAIISGIKQMKARAALVVVVSNELFQDITDYNPFVLDYLKTLGYLHQTIVKIAGAAYLLEFGRARLMKGGEDRERDHDTGNRI
ncbi:bifunctional adenosylcobinamide kinase/adenosylcobinamide-phosphate guanylyltransferase [Scopulibacillus cellulosilyticus]